MALEVTPAQTVGPFFAFCLLDEQKLVADDAPGAIRLEGQVTDGEGIHVPDALIEIWQADPQASFASSPWGVRRDAPPPESFPGFGRSGTDEGGWYRFVTLKPGRVPGPGGVLQAPHIAMIVQARGLLNRLVTRVYFPDEDQANASDPVLSSIEDRARAQTLIARPEEGVLRFDIRLQGENETCCFDV